MSYVAYEQLINDNSSTKETFLNINTRIITMVITRDVRSACYHHVKP